MGAGGMNNPQKVDAGESPVPYLTQKDSSDDGAQTSLSNLCRKTANKRPSIWRMIEWCTLALAANCSFCKGLSENFTTGFKKGTSAIRESL
jgi:hypothetical protein